MTDYLVKIGYSIDSSQVKKTRQEIDGINKELDESKKQSKEFSDNLTKGAKIAATAVAAAGAAVSALTIRTLRNNQAINDSALFTGDSAQNIADLTGVLVSAGVEFARVSDLINRVNERVQEAEAGSQSFIDLFSNIGLSVDALSQSQPTEVLRDIVIAINNIEDSALRARATNQLLGDSNVDVLKVASSYDEYNAKVQRARILGVSLSEAQLDAAQSFDDLQNKIGETATAITNQLVTSIVGLVDNGNDYAEFLDELTVRTRLGIIAGADYFENLGTEFSIALTAGQKFVEFQLGLIRFWGEAASAAGEYFNTVNQEVQLDPLTKKLVEGDITASLDFMETGSAEFSSLVRRALENGGLTFNEDGTTSINIVAGNFDENNPLRRLSQILARLTPQERLDAFERAGIVIGEQSRKIAEEAPSLSEAFGIDKAIADIFEFQRTFAQAVEAIDTGDFEPILNLVGSQAAAREIILERLRQTRELEEDSNDSTEKGNKLWEERVAANDEAYNSLQKIVEEDAAYQNLISDINGELELQRTLREAISNGTVDNQQEALRFLDNEREIQQLLNRARAEGIDITEEQVEALIQERREIEGSNNAILERAEIIQDIINDTVTSVGNLLADEIIRGLDEGKFAFEDFLSDLGDLLVRSGIQQLVASLFSPQNGGSSVVGSFLTSLITGAATGGASSGSSSPAPSPTFADGGVFNTTTSGIFAEQGPEAVLPLRRNDQGQLGVIASNDSGKTRSVTINNNVTVNGSDNPRETADQTARAIDRLMENKFRQLLQKETRAGNSLQGALI